MAKSSSDDFDEQNAAALAEMLSDQATTEAIRLQIIREILDSSANDTFFETMYNEGIDLGHCPDCNHENHWLIPEDDLNVLGWVSSKKDIRVKNDTTAEDCKEFAEACSKKKTTV